MPRPAPDPEDELDGPPTRRDSGGTIEVFSTTCHEAYDRLNTLIPDDEGRKLIAEAAALIMILDGWRIVAPRAPADRPRVITRIFELHRQTEDYVARRSAQLQRR